MQCKFCNTGLSEFDFKESGMCNPCWATRELIRHMPYGTLVNIFADLGVHICLHTERRRCLTDKKGV